LHLPLFVFCDLTLSLSRSLWWMAAFVWLKNSSRNSNFFVTRLYSTALESISNKSFSSKGELQSAAENEIAFHEIHSKSPIFDTNSVISTQLSSPLLSPLLSPYVWTRDSRSIGDGYGIDMWSRKEKERERAAQHKELQIPIWARLNSLPSHLTAKESSESKWKSCVIDMNCALTTIIIIINGEGERERCIKSIIWYHTWISTHKHRMIYTKYYMIFLFLFCFYQTHWIDIMSTLSVLLLTNWICRSCTKCLLSISPLHSLSLFFLSAIHKHTDTDTGSLSNYNSILLLMTR
jgi:hypothetical protein